MVVNKQRAAELRARVVFRSLLTRRYPVEISGRLLQTTDKLICIQLLFRNDGGVDGLCCLNNEDEEEIVALELRSPRISKAVAWFETQWERLTLSLEKKP